MRWWARKQQTVHTDVVELVDLIRNQRHVRNRQQRLRDVPGQRLQFDARSARKDHHLDSCVQVRRHLEFFLFLFSWWRKNKSVTQSFTISKQKWIWMQKGLGEDGKEKERWCLQWKAWQCHGCLRRKYARRSCNVISMISRGSAVSETPRMRSLVSGERSGNEDSPGLSHTVSRVQWTYESVLWGDWLLTNHWVFQEQAYLKEVGFHRVDCARLW